MVVCSYWKPALENLCSHLQGSHPVWMGYEVMYRATVHAEAEADGVRVENRHERGQQQAIPSVQTDLPRQVSPSGMASVAQFTVFPNRPQAPEFWSTGQISWGHIHLMGASEELTKRTPLACMFWRHQGHLPLADSECHYRHRTWQALVTPASSWPEW